jgi:hypothetical protein
MAMSDEAKAELAAAVKILRDDGVHVHKTYAKYMSTKDAPPTEETKEEVTEGGPPPAKEEPTKEPKKRGIWWGERE